MSSDPNINKGLGDRLKSIRAERKMTRELLAEKIDVSSRFLADVESGKVGVSLATLTKICKLLGVSSDYLLGITYNMENEQEYREIETRLKQIEAKYLPFVNEMIISFTKAIECSKEEK